MLIDTYLIQSGTTLNPAWRGFMVCTEARPCKRIASCKQCSRRRRAYFVHSGSKYAEAEKLNSFVTISWPLKENDDPWSMLIRGSQTLALGKRVRAGRYIKVLALGDRGTPHLHLLMKANEANVLVKYAHKKWGGKVVTQILAAFDAQSALGYLYDQNFLPTFRRKERPKRMRLISASKGMKCGFPIK